MANTASFNKKDYSLFMINCLSHDFVHDYNPSNMTDRLKKIKQRIALIETNIQLQVGGTISSQIGGYGPQETIQNNPYMLKHLQSMNNFVKVFFERIRRQPHPFLIKDDIIACLLFYNSHIPSGNPNISTVVLKYNLGVINIHSSILEFILELIDFTNLIILMCVANINTNNLFDNVDLFSLSQFNKKKKKSKKLERKGSSRIKMYKKSKKRYPSIKERQKDIEMEKRSAGDLTIINTFIYSLHKIMIYNKMVSTQSKYGESSFISLFDNSIVKEYLLFFIYCVTTFIYGSNVILSTQIQINISDLFFDTYISNILIPGIQFEPKYQRQSTAIIPKFQSNVSKLPPEIIRFATHNTQQVARPRFYGVSKYKKSSNLNKSIEFLTKVNQLITNNKNTTILNGGALATEAAPINIQLQQLNEEIIFIETNISQPILQLLRQFNSTLSEYDSSIEPGVGIVTQTKSFFTNVIYKTSMGQTKIPDNQVKLTYVNNIYNTLLLSIKNNINQIIDRALPEKAHLQFLQQYKINDLQIPNIPPLLFSPGERRRQHSSPETLKLRSSICDVIENTFLNINKDLKRYKKTLDIQLRSLNVQQQQLNRQMAEAAKAAAKAQRGELIFTDIKNINEINSLICYKILERYGFMNIATNQPQYQGPNGEITQNFSLTPDNEYYLLTKQIQILNNIVNKTNISTVDRDILNAFHERLADISKRIGEKRFNKTQLETQIKATNGKFIINNAAPERVIGIYGEEYKKYYFCPLSSVIDAQATCTYKTATNNNPPDILEHPAPGQSIQYKIDDNRFGDTTGADYYNATILYNRDNTVKIDVEIETIEQDAIFITRFVDLNVNKETTPVAATRVYSDLISIIISRWHNDPAAYLSGAPGGEIINQELSTVIPTLPNEDAKRRALWRFLRDRVSFLEILKVSPIKNFGDLFQELAVIFKNGGIINGANYTPRPGTIIPYNPDGSGLRLGLMGDRPSGLRLALLLANATGNNINPNAYGGYLGDGGGNSGLERDDKGKYYTGPLIINREPQANIGYL